MAPRKKAVPRKTSAKKKVGAPVRVTKTVDQKISEAIGKVTLFEGEPVVVRVGLGTTRSLGQPYEFMRLSVEVSLPCDAKNVTKAYKVGKAFVERKLEELEAENLPSQPETVDEIDL